MVSNGKPTVLVVDDELANRALVRAYLGADYDLKEASNVRRPWSS